MKKDVHSKDYRPVVFEDLNNGFRILTRSTAKSSETTKWEDGKEYPLVKVHISSASHPFFTGQEKLVDIEGRVDKFKARKAAAEKARLNKVKVLKQSLTQPKAKAIKDENPKKDSQHTIVEE
jgi:large subunit ribosomal protein L31